MRRQFKWTDKQKERLEKVKDVLNTWRAYWPMTLRQIYYQLVSQEIIANKSSEYKMLSIFLKAARLDGLIEWRAMEDRVRSRYHSAGFDDKQHFIDQEVGGFLSGYHRDSMQSQTVFIEVWIEKDALSSIFSGVSRRYDIATVVCRGFSSVTFLKEYRDRVSSARGHGKRPIMLYFGDFDPSGLEMLSSMEETLVSEMDVTDVEFKRIALTKDDIHDHNLPHDPSAVKPSDSRYQKFVDEHGEYAVELDALPPDVLEAKIVAAIENELDMDAFEQEKATEIDEENYLDELKSKVSYTIEGIINGDDDY